MGPIDGNTTGRRGPRLWVVETLVVLGIVAFGYFALNAEAPRWTESPVVSETSAPLFN